MASAKTIKKRPVIVVGYDGSPTSRAAVDHAAREAGRVRTALGSVSQEVLHRASVPVVVIPHVPDGS